MLLLRNKLNEVLNLLCMRNGKLVDHALRRDECRVTVCNTGMLVRLTEIEYTCRSDNIPLLAYYSL